MSVYLLMQKMLLVISYNNGYLFYNLDPVKSMLVFYRPRNENL